ncbi:MAG: FecR domain-containing protein [Flavitalea sp.]
MDKNMDVSQAKALLQRYREGEITAEEKQLVEDWYQRLVDKGEWNWARGEKEAMSSAMKSYLLNSIAESAIPASQTGSIRLLRTGWLRYAAAILLLLGTVSAYFLLSPRPQQQASLTHASSIKTVHDIEAGKSGAILTLSDGSSITLDSATSGVLSTQGSAKVVLSNGQVAYKTENMRSSETVYNTMSTPNGRQYKLLLPDGTAVWLNAASSITYPTAFTGKERKVSITGEAYFEVTKDPSKKFLVSAVGAITEVLGTHFNFNAYNDEKDLKVSLLEGAVKVIKDETVSMLAPGEQAQIRANGQSIINKNIDLDEVMAWKNGLFYFDRTNLMTIMLQVERWYDADIIYQGDVKEMNFSGAIPRKENISEVLKMLELTGVIHFRVEGKKVYVTR